MLPPAVAEQLHKRIEKPEHGRGLLGAPRSPQPLRRGLRLPRVQVPAALQDGYDIARKGVTMPNTAAKRLYDLLDSLVALRLQFATGIDGDKALSPLGRAKMLAVCTVLDTAIHGTKRIIGAIERPKPPMA